MYASLGPSDRLGGIISEADVNQAKGQRQLIQSDIQSDTTHYN
jgi:hypothetical protein